MENDVYYLFFSLVMNGILILGLVAVILIPVFLTA